MRYTRLLRILVVLIGLTLYAARVHAHPLAQNAHGVAPTYTVFATREGLVGHETANGHIIQPRDRFVALPSTSVLSSYQGNEYQVRITYNGRSVVAPVWDVGPWNTNDDYWAKDRLYGDLPVGVPMAQAAYLEGYNGGLDEFGRRVNLPGGIDIADGTFWDDLGMSKSDWVQVSFLWLGEDPGPGNAANIVPPPTQGNQEIPPSKPGDAWGGVSPPAPQPQQVDIPSLEEGMIAVDNGESGYQVNDAIWYEAGCGLNGQHHWTYSTPDPGSSENHAIWRPPETLDSGTYELKVYIPACGEVSATRSANYRVTYSGKVTEVTLDQQAVAGSWASLGTYHFDQQGPHLVELDDITDDSMLAIRFDAMAWVKDDAAATEETNEPTPDTTPPSSSVVAVTLEDQGYRVSWSGTDENSGIASYDVQVRRLPRGGWRNWLIETPATDAWFGPHEEKDFAFRVRARDNAGNEEAWPDEADMDTLP